MKLSTLWLVAGFVLSVNGHPFTGVMRAGLGFSTPPKRPVGHRRGLRKVPKDSTEEDWMIAKFNVEYKQGSEAEEWELTDLFCLRCGAKNVWRENRKDAGGPDFTVMGVPSHLCLECSASFIGRLAPAEIDELDRQRFEAFRKALAIPGAKPLPELPC